jgi:hypothetical protein
MTSVALHKMEYIECFQVKVVLSIYVIELVHNIASKILQQFYNINY